MLWNCCIQYASKLGIQQWPQDWKRSVFIPISKKGNAKECSNNCTIALISRNSKVLVTQCCPTLCYPMDCSLRGSSVHGTLQARILEWLPFPSPGDPSNPGAEFRSPVLQADSLPLSHQGSPYASKVKLKILQTRPQQYMNWEIPDVQAGF